MWGKWNGVTCCTLVCRTYLEGKGLNVQATLDGETSFVYAINKICINENISASGHFLLHDSCCVRTHEVHVEMRWADPKFHFVIKNYVKFHFETNMH